ncbi:hypothetical protein MRX96_035037 [Rhipicephalus microplus]
MKRPEIRGAHFNTPVEDSRDGRGRVVELGDGRVRLGRHSPIPPISSPTHLPAQPRRHFGQTATHSDRATLGEMDDDECRY